MYPPASVFCANGPTVIVDVVNPTTGRTWMDRNLGASQVATSSTDSSAYGDYYQWGRRSDGHQCLTSPNTATLSSVDQPTHGNFITTSSLPHNWRSPKNDNLWQGVSGINNPCPSGYRLPTETELNNERLSWVQAPISSTNNSAGAFASPLKLPLSGYRGKNCCGFSQVGIGGYYWSSTVVSDRINHLAWNSSTALMSTRDRAVGYPLRCIKN